MGITIFKIFIWGDISWIYVQKSRFTAPLTPGRKTKILSAYPTIDRIFNDIPTQMKTLNTVIP